MHAGSRAQGPAGSVLSTCQLLLGLGSVWHRGGEATPSEGRLLGGGDAQVGSLRIYWSAPGGRAVQPD